MTLAELEAAANTRWLLECDAAAGIRCTIANANRGKETQEYKPFQFNPLRDQVTGECLL